ncbi:MAG: hypothetical protein V3R87_09325, partial [Dehalococcoidia bacterium]
MAEVLSELELKMVKKGVPANIARHVSGVFNDLDEMRVYFGEQLFGDSGFFVGTEFKNGRPTATQHIMTEFMQSNIPLPDPRQMRRAMSRTRRITGTFFTNMKRARFRTKGTALLEGADPFEDGSVSWVRSGPGVEITHFDGTKSLTTWEDFSRRYTGIDITSKNAFVPAEVDELWKIDHLNDRASAQMMDFYMQKFWKPAVLLRLAWPVRVIGEEQLRMAAGNLDSVFRHPWSYMAWVMGDDATIKINKLLDNITDGKVQLRQRGQTNAFAGLPDDLAEIYGLDALSQEDLMLRMSDEHQQTMSNRDMGFLGRQRRGQTNDAWVRINTETKQGRVALFSELRQMSRDTAVSARVARDGPEATTEWLLDSAAGRRELDRLAGGKDSSSAKRSYVDDDIARNQGFASHREATAAYVESVDARIHMKTGGSTTLFDPAGNVVRRDHIFAEDSLAGYHYQIDVRGNPDLIDIVGTGKFKGSDVRDVTTLRAWRKAAGEFETFFDGADMPTINTKIAKELFEGGDPSRYDAFVDWAFHQLMARPTNFLSRSPAFRQFYWQNAEELQRFMSVDDSAQVMRSAREANLSQDTLDRMQATHINILNRPTAPADPLIIQRNLMATRLSEATDDQLARLVFEQPDLVQRKDLWDTVVGDTVDELKVVSFTGAEEAALALGILVERHGRNIDDLAAIFEEAVGGSSDLNIFKSTMGWLFAQPVSITGAENLVWDYISKDIATVKNIKDGSRILNEGLQQLDGDILAILNGLDPETALRMGVNPGALTLDQALPVDTGLLTPGQYIDWYLDVQDLMPSGMFAELFPLMDAKTKMMNANMLVADAVKLPDEIARLIPDWSQHMASGQADDFLDLLIASDDAPKNVDEFLAEFDIFIPAHLPANDVDAWKNESLARWLKSVEHYEDLEGFGAFGRAFDNLVDDLSTRGIDFDDVKPFPFVEDAPPPSRFGDIERPTDQRPGDVARGTEVPRVEGHGPPIGDPPGGTRPPGKPAHMRWKRPSQSLDQPALPPGFIRREANRRLSADLANEVVGKPEMVPDWVDQHLTAVEDGVPVQHLKQYFSEDISETWLSLEDMDNVAKASSLENTKDLLYDLSKRHHVTDMLRHVFPFGEAFIEIFQAWTKLMITNPNLIRRGQQAIQGAQNAGIITTDPNTGEDYFNYPGGGLLANWMMEGNPLKQNTSPVGVQFRGRVEGLNLVAGQYIPGFGPAVQIPVSYFKHPRWDTLKDLVLPFGELRIENAGDLANSIIPPYFRRIMQATGVRDPEMQRLHQTMTIDIMRSWIVSGEMGNTEDEWAKNWDRANEIAAKTSLIRGLAQFGLPTGPEMVFTLED